MYNFVGFIRGFLKLTQATCHPAILQIVEIPIQFQILSDSCDLKNKC